MPRVRPEFGLVFALCGAPQLARADAFVPPDDKTAVGVSITIENLDEHPDYWFVLWPDGCLSNDTSYATYTILDFWDDNGRDDLSRWDDCAEQRLFAFPSDTYDMEKTGVPEAARRQLSYDPPTDPRVLVLTIEARDKWWVPDEVDLQDIEDVYRVGIDAGALTLTPLRVRFHFGQERVLERAFDNGRRPPLPDEEDIPPAPPADAPPMPASSTSSEAADVIAASPDLGSPPAVAPAPVAAAAAPSPDADGSPVAPAPAPAAEPPPVAAEPEEISEPWPPPPVVYGGLCLLVALAAGLALRRRQPPPPD